MGDVEPAVSIDGPTQPLHKRPALTRSQVKRLREGYTVRILVSRIRLWMRVLFGRMYNLAGIPGLVSDCSYSGAKAEITVKQGDLFTIISVNGLDIYFHRLTGSIDGVGWSTNLQSESVRIRNPR